MSGTKLGTNGYAVATPPQKEKANYQSDSGLFFTDLVPER